MVQGFNSADKWRASQGIDLFRREVLDSSQGSRLGDQLLRGPQIDPLISQIGSLVGKEFGHALHSSTTNISIRNDYPSMALHLRDLGIILAM